MGFGVQFPRWGIVAATAGATAALVFVVVALLARAAW